MLWFIDAIVLSLSYVVYRMEQSKTRGTSRKRLEENMIKSVKLFKRSAIY